MTQEFLDSEFVANNELFLFITLIISYIVVFGGLFWISLKRKIKKSGLTAAEYFKKNPYKGSNTISN